MNPAAYEKGGKNKRIDARKDIDAGWDLACAGLPEGTGAWSLFEEGNQLCDLVSTLAFQGQVVSILPDVPRVSLLACQS